MSSVSSSPALSPAKRAILGALWYFEIFQHPLTEEEVFLFSNCPGMDPGDIKIQLNELRAEGLVFQFDGFYQVQNDPSWVPRRLDFNRRADAFVPLARRMTRLIGHFPFVRAVFVSGSLSKHCVPPDGDIDYFLITDPGRLWLARTLLVVFKKVFLFNSHKYFCVNYFVDTQHLEIEDKNLFTATEIRTLLPLYGPEWYERFCAANEWVSGYLPNFPWRAVQGLPLHGKSPVKRVLERLLNNRVGDWLDRQAMGLTVAYWRRKFRHFDPQTFDNALRSRRYVSKHHPLYFQRKVMRVYTERIAQVP